MGTLTQTRRVYSADELHRLRSACSQPKLKESIEERDGDDAELVKEHVLRGSQSLGAPSWQSRTSATASTRTVSYKENRHALPSERETLFHPPRDHHVPPADVKDVAVQQQMLFPMNNSARRSPTPSLKRQKIKHLVKAHGSPTHVRVTAGGRIVPSAQSPLCHPRFGYSAIKVNGGLVKFAPVRHLGKNQEWSQATQNGCIAQDPEGHLCQIVNGVILPLTEYNGILQLYMDAPNVNIQRGSPPDGPLHHGVPAHQLMSPFPSEPSPAAQLDVMELEYGKLDYQLKEVDKTEVLHGRSMGRSAKDALIAKRRELVTSMDKVRRAIKALKEQGVVGEEAAGQPSKVPSALHPASRPPPFVPARQPQIAMEPLVVPHGAYPPFYPTPFAGPSGFPTVEGGFADPWPVHAHGLMIPPAPFDGSLSIVPMSSPVGDTNPAGAVPPAVTSNAHSAQSGPSRMEAQRAASPNRSRAIAIKLPDEKSSAAARSTLNPMSPAYKPFNSADKNDGSSSNDSQPHKGAPKPTSAEIRASLDNDASPGGKTRMHSSSVSSFETADFFPRNTREYSTRQYAYPAPVFHPDEKENLGPERAEPDAAVKMQSDDEDSLLEPVKSQVVVSPQDGGYCAPTAPPGTPTDGAVLANKHVHLTIGSAEVKKINSANLKFQPLPDRERHNISPKARRHKWQIVREGPSRESSEPSSSAVRAQKCQDQPRATSSPHELLDFSNRSRDWIEGYQAGLNRRPVGADRDGQFFDGYCSGLLKSKPVAAELGTGSPAQNLSCRPDPIPGSMRCSSDGPAAHQLPHPRVASTPIESTQQSLDTLKQAIIAPNNEAAVLTPGPYGPHVDEARFNLGAWGKQHASQTASQTSYGFPTQVSQDQHKPTNVIAGKANVSDSSNRISSMSSIDASLHRQMPGFRAISPHLDWKSASSVARQAGLANRSFANGQLDGAFLTQRAEMPGNATFTSRRRCREGSLDGVNSPLPLTKVTTAPTSPRSSPVKDSSRKSQSPAKAKFESIAGKVGIKTSRDQSEPNSPPGKRRWRDVWRGGRKEEEDTA